MASSATKWTSVPFLHFQCSFQNCQAPKATFFSSVRPIEAIPQRVTLNNNNNKRKKRGLFSSVTNALTASSLALLHILYPSWWWHYPPIRSKCIIHHPADRSALPQTTEQFPLSFHMNQDWLMLNRFPPSFFSSHVFPTASLIQSRYPQGGGLIVTRHTPWEL